MCVRGGTFWISDKDKDIYRKRKVWVAGLGNRVGVP